MDPHSGDLKSPTEHKQNMQHKTDRSAAEHTQAVGSAAAGSASVSESSTGVTGASSASSSTGSVVSSPDSLSAAPSHTPASFFSSSLSSTDSAYHRIAVLYCPGCLYLEFPGCLMHNGLLANIKGNGYMSCVACELDRKAKGGSDVPGGADNMLSMVCATDSAEPWSVACQHCNAVKADTIPWIIADSESVRLAAAMQLEKEDVIPTTVLQCEQCKTSVFPLVGGSGPRLTRRHPVDPNRLWFDPDAPDAAPITKDSIPFVHYVAGCTGNLVPVPILMSKLEGKFCGQALPYSPYLPKDSSFVPGFIPPLEWLTGEAHKVHEEQEELRKDRFVLSAAIDHRTPVWRDKAFIGVFGDVFVRDTELEGGHIAESVDAMVFILDALVRSSATEAERASEESKAQEPLPFDFSTASWLDSFRANDAAAAGPSARGALAKVVETLRRSSRTIHHAKDALDALQNKDLRDAEKEQFNYRLIREWRRTLKRMQPGDVHVIPGGWIAAKAGHAIMHIIYRYAESFSFVTCNTGGGLTFHPSSVSDDGAKFLFRTSIRIDDIAPHRMYDDAFWVLFWRLQTVQSDEHDHRILYEVLLPALSGKPLAESIVAADPHAEWRTPQRAGTCFLKCVLECIRYLERSFGLSKPQTKTASFAVRRLWMRLCLLDLQCVSRDVVRSAKMVEDGFTDKDRKRTRTERLQRQMAAEGIPEKREKEKTVAGAASSSSALATPAPKPADSASAGAASAAPAASSVPSAAVAVTLPAESVSVENTPLHDESDLSMIRLATKQTAHAALKESKAGRLSATDLAALYSEIQQIEQTMTSMPVHVHTSSHIQPKLHMDALSAETFSLDSPSKRSTQQATAASETASQALVSASPAAQDKFAAASPFLFSGFDSFPLLLEESTQSALRELAGSTDVSYAKSLCDFQPIHARVQTLDDILRVLDQTVRLCEAIAAPNADSLNGYMQTLALIQGVLAHTIPLPGSSLPNSKAWFSRGLLSQEQVKLVHLLWRLGRFYLSAELSVESPAHVSSLERCVVMWTLLTMSDWSLRRAPSDRASPSALTTVLNGTDPAVVDAEGSAPFYMFDVCNGSGLHVRDMIVRMESHMPELAHLYGELVEYWSELESSAAAAGQNVRKLFPFPNSAAHQTASFQEDSASLQFTRDVAKSAGYIIERRGYGGKESSEIEAVARWTFAAEEGDYSIGQASFGALVPQLVRDHPEYANMRDLHFLFKLALVHTHPSCKVVKPGRYAERDASIYWSTQGMPMSNAVVIVYAKAFSKKELILINTRNIESYATPDPYLPASAKGSAQANQLGSSGGFGGLGGLMGSMGGFGGFGSLFGGMGGAASAGGSKDAEWSEEDVIHNAAPPLFDNLLTVESSERLMSVLTAPYLRIPLVLSFFSNKDRVDLLADRRLQKLLAACIFETGAWASRMHEEDVSMIPATAAANSGGAGSKARVGSPYGLLLNELTCSAGATLNPFLALLQHALALDTGHFSSASATCRLILFVARMAARMERFVRHTLQLMEAGAITSASDINRDFLRQSHCDLLALLHGPILSILLSYKPQALAVISEAVWVMSCIALVSASGLQLPSYLSALTPSPSLSRTLASTSRRFDPASAAGGLFPASCMVELLGSFAFVLTWHSMGIGIGKDLAEDEKEGERNQAAFGATEGASGADLMAQFAERMQASMAKSKLKSQSKDDPKEKEKASKPPLPEVELFQALQSARPAILAWAEATQKTQPAQLQHVFDELVQWVHGHKVGEADATANGGAAEQKKLNPQTAARKPVLSRPGVSVWQQSDAVPGRFISPEQRLEIDLQSAAITFYDHDVFPVHDMIARSDDFQSVFGPAPQHYALIHSHTHMQSYGLFGSSYTLQWWDRNLAGKCINQPAPAQTPSKHNLQAPASVGSALPEGKWKCGARSCGRINPFSALRCQLCSAYQPMLSGIEKYGLSYRGLAFTRRYGSTYLAPQESWIVEMLEPMLRTLFGPELDTLNYSLWMREQPWSEQDDKIAMLALDANTFKLIVLHRSQQLLECFNLIEHARVLYRSLVFTSNGRMSLAGLPGEDAPVRMQPWESVDRFAVGAWEEVQKKAMSFTLQRRRQASPTTSVLESFISPSLLTGLLPKVLLEHYHFYLVDEITATAATEHSLSVSSDSHARPAAATDLSWFGRGDILGFLQPAFLGQMQWNFDLHVKLVNKTPETSTERKLDDVSAEAMVWDQYHALVSQVMRGAAGSTNTATLIPAPLASPAPSPSPSLSPSPLPSPSASPLSAPRHPASSKPFRWLLLNLMTAAPGSFLSRLASVLVRLDDLSHILVWSESNALSELMRDRRRTMGAADGLDDMSLGDSQSAGVDPFRITRVDLPRLKLSFRPRRVRHADGTTSWRLFSNDHAGFYISDTSSESLSTLLAGIPNSVLLENEKRELWLLVPNTPLKRPQVFTCPFSNELLADRNHARWLDIMDTRFYIFPVHLSHTFLLSNTLASTFYLLLLNLLARNYSACARYCETCEIDTALTAEERFVFQLFDQSLHDQHPDAHAIRLKLYVCIWLSGEPLGWKTAQGESWSLEDEYNNYLRKIAHIAATCRLSNEEEEIIYQQISYDEAQKKDTAPNEQQNRAAIRAAIVKHLAGQDAASSSSSSSSDDSGAPARAPLFFKGPKRDGLTTAWWSWQSKLETFFASEWRAGMWSGMVCYARPTKVETRDLELLELVGEVFNDTMIGSMHKRGFLFLMDCLLGASGGMDPILVDSTDPSCEDCSFSLGVLLSQIHLLKATEWGEKIPANPPSHFLPLAVAAVFGSGFIPTPNNAKWRIPVYSLPGFPPLPVVPYRGMERAMQSGFLLHKQGTPVNSLFTILAQWSSGFVRMASEWKARVTRPAVPGEQMKSGYAVLQGWATGQPSNTACQSREIRPFSGVSGCSLDAASLASLVSQLLQPVDVEPFLVEITAASTCMSELPFDVSKHPAAQTYVAKSMLTRMGNDMGEYARQVQSQRTFQIKGISTPELVRMAKECETEGVEDSVDRLSSLHGQLAQLRSEDWKQVQQLRVAIERMANEVPGLAPTAAESSAGASIPALRFGLSRYTGQGFSVRLDYLTALLLSSQPEQDVLQLNPHLPRDSIPTLLQLLSTLLLLTNRVGLIDRVLFEIDELRAALHGFERKIQSVRVSRPLALARSLSGGTQLIGIDDPEGAGPQGEASLHAMAELDELAQQIGVHSTTLAENLRTARHYMSPSSAQPSDSSVSSSAASSFVFDPRFLVFEYIFNILLREMQIEMITTFAKAAWSKTTGLVQQMIMGAGKSTVVGPLLCLMLADGSSLVTMVVPSALLPMSRAVLRARFSSLIPKRIHTLEYDRSTKDDPKLVAKLLYKLNAAQKKQGLVIATAVSVKSLMLKYLELLVALQTADYNQRVMPPGEAQQLQIKSSMVDGLAQVLTMWRKGTLILDEIDLLLHPLKSELNFPCGSKLALQPAPNRWSFPLHLLDAFFFEDTRHLSMAAFQELEEAQAILAQLAKALQRGAQEHMLQTRPHLILLNGSFYHETLKPILAAWSLLWLKAKGVSSAIPDSILLQYMCVGWSDDNVATAVTSLLSKQQMVLLNLAHGWLNSYLLHILSKINRVGYGLLRPEEMEGAAAETMSHTRRLVAVPFLAKDVPSRSSEFAQPEVVLGLTILAYRIEGLRATDLRHLVSTLKNALSQEMGPEHARPSARLFEGFVRAAKALHMRRAQQAQLQHAATSSSKAKTMLAASSSVSSLKILPLSQFSLTDPSQLSSLFALVQYLPGILDYYLESYLFPTCMTHQVFNLSASGQELGNGMLFATSLGFSGTPSDLLPLELGKCVYERGSDGKVLNILTSPSVVSFSIKYGWSVTSLLLDIAQASPPFHSLIDTGALITGMDNRQVAEFLLEHGLAGMEGVVYLDAQDNQMILLRTGGAPVPASQCGLSLSRRFSFFDQIHTTGIDMKHSPSATAVVTLGKDMTFRDYAQGAFRMRQIGQGQRIHLFVIPEVLALIERELKLNESAASNTNSLGVMDPDAPVRTNPKLLSNLPTHVAAWLTINSMRMEQLQFFQLCLQNMHSVWRKRAFAQLLQDSTTASASQSAQARRHLRFDLNAVPAHPDIFWLVECINLFKAAISFDIDDAIPVTKPFFSTLKTLLSQHTTFLQTDEQCLAVAAVLNQALEAASAILPRHAFDREMINEQEREQEQEKHQEVLKDPRAQRAEEMHLPWRIDQLNSTTELMMPASSRLLSSDRAVNTTSRHPFFPLAAFALEGRPLPLSFPRYLLCSHNYYRQSWAINPGGHRRLKNIYVMLEWCVPNAGSSSVAASAEAGSAAVVPKAFLPPPTLTEQQRDRFARAFQMLDADRDGVLKGHDLLSLLAVLSELLDEDLESARFFAGVDQIDQAQFVRLMQAVTKRQGASKIAGFVRTGPERDLTAAALMGCVDLEESSRFFVVLPLSEAQALRRAVHTGHPMFRSASAVQFALWSIDGHLIETTLFYKPASRQVGSSDPELSNYQLNIGLQTARFFNGELYYSEEEIVSLLRGVSAIHPAHRRTLLNQLLLCRHRDHRSSAKTPLESIMHLEDESHWALQRALVVAIRARIDAAGLSLLQAFHLFDLDGSGVLDADELWSACAALGLLSAPNAAASDSASASMIPALSQCVHPEDIAELIRAGSSEDNKLKQLDFGQWARILRTRAEAAAMGEEANATAAPTAERPQLESKEESESSSSSSSVRRSLPQVTLICMPALARPTPPPSYVAPTVQSVSPPAPRVPAPAASPSAAWSQPSPPPAAVAAPPAAAAAPLPRSPPVVSVAEWDCSICTYHNGGARSRCEICDTPRQR